MSALEDAVSGGFLQVCTVSGGSLHVFTFYISSLRVVLERNFQPLQHWFCDARWYCHKEGSVIAARETVHYKGSCSPIRWLLTAEELLATMEASCHNGVCSPQRSVITARESDRRKGLVLVARQSDYRKEACSPQKSLCAARECDRRKGVLLIAMETACCKGVYLQQYSSQEAARRKRVCLQQESVHAARELLDCTYCRYCKEVNSTFIFKLPTYPSKKENNFDSYGLGACLLLRCSIALNVAKLSLSR
ncbi:hypothetical protein DVH24_014222 [Malus domestica]|uniref:Uncharacterized protein n=1 Tax=Malus domestica TaxID=3750 RepID=A0A498JEV8_MALDO|nr:hypothetical protein DVH24_014222 [Malus domestica]